MSREYIRVSSNMGTSSRRTFGEVGSVLEIRHTSLYDANGNDLGDWLKPLLDDDKNLSNWNIASRNSNILYGCQYKTRFEEVVYNYITVNNTQYNIDMPVPIYEFISDTIELRANPIIVYNGEEIDPNNKLNELIRLRHNDVLEIRYGENISMEDISSLLDKKLR